MHNSTRSGARSLLPLGQATLMAGIAVIAMNAAGAGEELMPLAPASGLSIAPLIHGSDAGSEKAEKPQLQKNIIRLTIPSKAASANRAPRLESVSSVASLPLPDEAQVAAGREIAAGALAALQGLPLAIPASRAASQQPASPAPIPELMESAPDKNRSIAASIGTVGTVDALASITGASEASGFSNVSGFSDASALTASRGNDTLTDIPGLITPEHLGVMPGRKYQEDLKDLVSFSSVDESFAALAAPASSAGFINEPVPYQAFTAPAAKSPVIQPYEAPVVAKYVAAPIYDSPPAYESPYGSEAFSLPDRYTTPISSPTYIAPAPAEFVPVAPPPIASPSRPQPNQLVLPPPIVAAPAPSASGDGIGRSFSLRPPPASGGSGGSNAAARPERPSPSLLSPSLVPPTSSLRPGPGFGDGPSLGLTSSHQRLTDSGPAIASSASSGPRLRGMSAAAAYGYDEAEGPGEPTRPIARPAAKPRSEPAKLVVPAVTPIAKGKHGVPIPSPEQFRSAGKGREEGHAEEDGDGFTPMRGLKGLFGGGRKGR